MQTFLIFSVLFSLVFVNGFTDAPNSIAAAVGSGALEFKKAKTLAAVFDAVGVISFALLFPAVAKTSKDIALFGENASLALSAGMLSAVLFALAAWIFGIPTSESHAMSAAISGAAFFSGGSLGALSWIKIFAGLFLSSLIAAIMSRAVLFFIERKKPEREGLLSGQRIMACSSALMHGAQDGQKFLGLILIFSGSDFPGIAEILSVAAVISLGTFLCTERIVKRVAFETVRPNAGEGFSADISSIAVMLVSTLMGIPVSTSNIKVSALMGAGGKNAKLSSFLSMVFVWLLTFPVCFFLGGGIYKLLELLF